MKRFFVLSTVLMAFSVFDAAHASHGGMSSGAGHSGPVVTTSATTMPEGRFGLELSVDYYAFKTFSDETLTGFARNGEMIHTMDSMTLYFAGLDYGITDDLMVHARIPYVVRRNIRESEPPDGVTDHGDSQGIGDTSVMAQYRFFNDRGHRTESALVFGVKLPTGKTSVKDRNGVTFEPEMQPGSGSVDIMLGLAATQRFGVLSLDANVLWMLTGPGTQDSYLGDTINYNLAASYRLLTTPVAWDVFVEGNGLWKGKQVIDGVSDDNSGGNMILISPGFRVTYRDLSPFVSVGIPVVQNLNGSQSELKYRIVFGVSLLL